MNRTLGEWTRKDGSSLIVSGPIEICSVFRRLELNNETHALPGFETNANLIASSPDLYEACKRAFDSIRSYEQLREVSEELEKAIHKAEGRYTSIK